MWQSRFRIAVGIALALGGAVVMAGWVVRWSIWEFFPSGTAIVFNTALCFVLCGIALLLPAAADGRERRAGIVLAGTVAALALIQCVENLFGFEQGLDWAGLHRWYPDANPHPGRMAPNTALSFLVTGIYLLIARTPWGRKPASAALPALILAMGLLGFAAYSPLFDLTYEVLKVARMAFPVGLGFVLLGAALLAERHARVVTVEAEPRASAEERIYAFLGLAIAIQLTLAVVSYGSISALIDRTRWVEHTGQVRAAFERAMSISDRARAAWQDQLDTGKTDGGKRFRAEVAAAGVQFDRIERLIADNPVQSDLMRQLRTLIEDEFRQMAAATGSRALHLSQARQDALADRFREEEERLQAVRRSQSHHGAEATTDVIIAGNLLGLAVLIGAIWMILRQNAARSRLERALSDSNRELEGFAYSVSHDLRAPLRAVDGYAQMLEEDCLERLDEEGRRFVSQIRVNSRRMGGLIDDLLRFSRLSRQSLNMTRVDMNKLVDDVLREELQQLADRPPAIELQPLPEAHGDPALLRQVWVNLVSNAIKYSSRTAEPSIRIAGEPSGDEIRYEITDNGAGFDMTYYDKLFGIFQRLHRSDEFEGTGVGLAIVHRVIARHGGRVWAEGRINQGASFHFALPAGG